MYHNNEKLNNLDVYKDKACIHCGRKYPQTVLNIEGVIHHGEPYRCLDTKSCRKYKKKKIRKIDTSKGRIYTAEEFYKNHPKQMADDISRGFRWGEESRVFVKDRNHD